MKLEKIMLSEISQISHAEKDKHCTSLTCGIQKNKTNESIYKTNRFTRHRKQQTGRRRARRTNQEYGTNKYFILEIDKH